MASDPPKIFISYSHDSPEHAQHVLELAERLRKDGFDAQIDQYVAGTPVEAWPRWMLNQLDWADFPRSRRAGQRQRGGLGRQPDHPGVVPCQG
jgi:hypothetical protein